MDSVVRRRTRLFMITVIAVGIIGYAAVLKTNLHFTSTNSHPNIELMQNDSVQHNRTLNFSQKQEMDRWHGERFRQREFINATWLSEQQRERLLRLNRECSQLSDEERSLTPDWSEFLVDDRLRYVYCKVEKVACTTWKRTLLMLTGNLTPDEAANLGYFRVHNKQFLSGNNIKPLSAYTAQQIRHRLDTYFAFMFVRDPLERLVSAYRDKMFSINERIYKRLGRRIRRKFHRPGDKTPFSSLVRYIIRQSKRHRKLNIHWRPQTAICRPCYVHYQFIGHYDSLLNDADFVLRHITRTTHDAANTATFPRVDPINRHHVNSSKQLGSVLYKTLDPTFVDWLQTRLYALDYRLFSFTMHNFTDDSN